jgi:cytoskeletal protein CcmA (bactofilin family)
MTPLDLDLTPEPAPAAPAVLAARHRRALVVGLGGGRRGDSPMAKASFAERRLRATDTEPDGLVDALHAGALGPAAVMLGAGALPAAVAAATTAAGAGAGAAACAVMDVGACDGTCTGAGVGTSTSTGTGMGTGTGTGTGTGAGAGACMGMGASMRTGTGTGKSPATAKGARPQLQDALVVPAGAVIRGYLRCGALLLAGDVVGNIHCTGGPVVIRPGASLEGRLVASGDVYVCGTVGERGGGTVITTRGKLTLAPGARVDGDVRSGWLEVHDGAVLRGVAKRCED